MKLCEKHAIRRIILTLSHWVKINSIQFCYVSFVRVTHQPTSAVVKVVGKRRMEERTAEGGVKESFRRKLVRSLVKWAGGPDTWH